MDNFFALLLIAMLGAVLVSRYTGKFQPIWPLLVWVATVVFTNFFQGTVDAGMAYGGIICALLLRFEFMGGWVIQVVRTLESVAIVAILWALFRVLRGY
jgi:hypothetical protein